MTAMLVFFHLSFRLTANNFIHHKQYLESGVLLKQDTSRPRMLSRTNELSRPIVSWNKWGYTCVHLPAKDLTICIDIHPNPGHVPRSIRMHKKETQDITTSSTLNMRPSNYLLCTIVVN